MDDPRCSPISTLPIEVLQEIFLLCAPPGRDISWRWTPGLVSRKWRHAALGCVKLWSCILVNDVHWERMKDPEKKVEVWLKRSLAAPLDLAFEDGMVETLRIFNLLLEQRHRWRNVTLSLDVPDSIHALEQCRGQFPMLQRLHLELIPWNRNRNAPPIEAFSIAPQLTTLILHYLKPYRPINIPSQQITSLTVLESYYLRELELPNLQYLEISNGYDTDGGLDTNQFLQRSSCKLTSLKLKIKGTAVTGEKMLGTFRLVPDLEWFTFSILMGISGEVPLKEMLETLGASRPRPLLPKLRRLDISTGASSLINPMINAQVISIAKRRHSKWNKLGVVRLERLSWWAPVTRQMYERLRLLKDAGLVVSFCRQESNDEARIAFDGFTRFREDPGEDRVVLKEEEEDEDGIDGWQP